MIDFSYTNPLFSSIIEAGGEHMNYIGIDNKTALNRIKRKQLPFDWDLNIYRGCGHGCKYCFAMYSHSYLNDDNFFDTIYYKKNILECLEKELSSPKWKREVISIGGITDSYQPIEKKLKIMPEVLKLMIKYKTPIIISTKSDLVLRDIDLINELSKITYVNIAFTITTTNEKLRSVLEPGASPTERRFQALEKLKETNACLGVHLMPIIPYLTDSYENLEKIFKRSYDIGVDYILPGVMYLRGITKPNFLNFVKRINPDLYLKVNKLYQTDELKEYKLKIYKKINILKKQYPINFNYMKLQKDRLKAVENEPNNQEL